MCLSLRAPIALGALTTGAGQLELTAPTSLRSGARRWFQAAWVIPRTGAGDVTQVVRAVVP